jgi:response regulator RpfG family c-di-GMP phosphodiesterase
MVVAREPALAGLCPAFMHSPGIDVLQVTTDTQTLTVARDRQPCLIIQQIEHPPGASLGVMRQLKSDPRTSAIPLIAVACPEDRSSVAQTGVDIVINRPLVLREYWEAVRKFVRLPRRRALRESVNLRFSYTEADHRWQAFSRDLSPYGAYLKTDHRVTVGTRIRTMFRLPGDPATIECSAIVRRCCYTDVHTAGFAIEFEGMSQPDLDRLERFTDRSMRRTLFGLVTSIVVGLRRPG